MLLGDEVSAAQSSYGASPQFRALFRSLLLARLNFQICHIGATSKACIASSPHHQQNCHYSPREECHAPYSGVSLPPKHFDVAAFLSDAWTRCHLLSGKFVRQVWLTCCFVRCCVQKCHRQDSCKDYFQWIRRPSRFQSPASHWGCRHFQFWPRLSHLHFLQGFNRRCCSNVL